MFNLLLMINWYDKLVASLPNGKLFSWRAVFDAIPSILEKLPTTLILTLGGSIFGLVLALLFAIVKLNRVTILYPIQAFFKGDADLGSTDVDLLWYSFVTESPQSKDGD